MDFNQTAVFEALITSCSCCRMPVALLIQETITAREILAQTPSSAWWFAMLKLFYV